MSLYDDIGAATVAQVITVFYERAFTDPIISHFFFSHDRAHITKQQIDFATAMLGGPRRYQGKSLAEAHAQLALRAPHFARRQVLMAEVLEEIGVPEDYKRRWLAMEEALRPLIVNS